MVILKQTKILVKSLALIIREDKLNLALILLTIIFGSVLYLMPENFISNNWLILFKFCFFIYIIFFFFYLNAIKFYQFTLAFSNYRRQNLGFLKKILFKYTTTFIFFLFATSSLIIWVKKEQVICQLNILAAFLLYGYFHIYFSLYIYIIFEDIRGGMLVFLFNLVSLFSGLINESVELCFVDLTWYENTVVLTQITLYKLSIALSFILVSYFLYFHKKRV